MTFRAGRNCGIEPWASVGQRRIFSATLQRIALCVFSWIETSAAQFCPQQNYRVCALLWGIHFLLGHAKWPPLPDCIQYDSPLAESNLMKYANSATYCCLQGQLCDHHHL